MIGSLPRRPERSAVVRAVPMTVLLGATVAVSWVGVRGTGIIRGPGPWLHDTWFIIWAIQALLAFALLIATEWTVPSASRRAMVETVLLAWVGELLVVALLLPAVIGELDAFHAPYVWLVGTGFGLQPLAAILGGIIAGSRRLDRPIGSGRTDAAHAAGGSVTTEDAGRMEADAAALGRPWR